MSDTPKLPEALEAEQAVLGALLNDHDGAAADDAMDLLRADDFSRDGHVRLFRVMRLMHAEGAAIDPITLRQALERQGELAAVGGIDYLSYLLDVVPHSANVIAHGAIVRTHAVARRLIRAGTDIVEEAYAQRLGGEDLAARAESLLLEATDRASVRGAERIKQPIQDALALVEARAAEPATLLGVGTGIRELDEITTGWREGDLAIIAARPGGGKTALGLHLAQYAAVECQIPTVFFSLEMGQEALTMRLLAAEALVDSRRLERGRLRDHEWGKVVKAAQRIGPAPLFLDDSAERTIGGLRAAARRLHRREGVRLVIVDYLQLLSGDEREENRQQEMRMVSKGLKAMAKQLRIPVLGMCQLNRQMETRGKDSRPRLSDLRESGAIEQDADVVIFPWVNPDDAAQYDHPPCTLIVAKQRNGPTGDVKVLYDRHTGRFEDLPTVYEGRAA